MHKKKREREKRNKLVTLQYGADWEGTFSLFVVVAEQLRRRFTVC
jgi:hypothetical protein